MPDFICDTCDGIENTVNGTYHLHKQLRWKDPSFNGKVLCSECTPKEREDGTIYHKYVGHWHGQWPKELATEEMVLERGDWLEQKERPQGTRGFIYYGRFEYLRPQIQRRMKNAARREKARRRKERGL